MNPRTISIRNVAVRLLLAAIACYVWSIAEPVNATALVAASSADRWIVVTAPAFATAIEPLKNRRQGEGFDVIVIKPADILSPAEIKADTGGKLLQELRKHWKPAPAKTYVLLVGTAIAARELDAPATQIPFLRGTIGRMKNQPSDNGYGCDEGKIMPRVAVGRWPVRTVNEAKALVAKTIAYEVDGRHAAWRRSITMLVGSPGGHSLAEKSMGNWFLNSACQSTSQRINSLWTMRSLYHIASSPWYVPDEALHDQSLALLRQGQAFTVHMGHSSPAGLWSDGARFLDRQDWQQLNMPHGAGVLVTCGCYSCCLDIHGRGQEDGFGLAAIRSDGGPVAVIGASEESFSVAGYTAFNGLLRAFGDDKLPTRLGDAWLYLKEGIESGPVDPFTQTMLDYGDGSNGRIPMETQRREHLEMWTLLGDPALCLPDVTPEIKLHGPASVKPGDLFTLHGEVPKTMKVDQVHVTLERRLGAAPTDLSPVPDQKGEKQDAAILANYRKAQDYVLAEQNGDVQHGEFRVEMRVPAGLKYDGIVVRAAAANSEYNAVGVMKIRLLH